MVSIFPRCSALALSWSAINFKYFALSLGWSVDQLFSKAFWADWTALSTSFSFASGTVAQTSLFSGFNVSIFFPEDESTHSPLNTF